LELRNHDNGAMSIETLFEKKPHLNFKLADGQVLLPYKKSDLKSKIKKEENVLQIPI
jgi:hypothetical protein